MLRDFVFGILATIWAIIVGLVIIAFFFAAIGAMVIEPSVRGVAAALLIICLGGGIFNVLMEAEIRSHW